MLKINELRQLDLGIQGENLEQTIQIDASEWLVEYPSGSISIWHKRNGDSVPSATGATLDRESGILSWSPSSTDTYAAGLGTANVRLTENNIIKKSRDVQTNVAPSVTLSGATLSSGWQYYIEAVDGMKDAAEDAQDAAEDAQDAAEAAQEAAELAQDMAEIAAGIAIAQAGQLKFEINSSGHLIMSYTDEVPIVDEEEEENE